MVADKFGLLLEDLGKALRIKLSPDKNSACVIRFKNGIQVQIEMESQGDHIILCADLGTITPGRFRENIFREALKANGLPIPSQGIFAYSKKNESLVLFDRLPLEDLSGIKLADFITKLVQKGDLWKSSIARGEVPSFMGTEFTFGKKASASGMFGM